MSTTTRISELPDMAGNTGQINMQHTMHTLPSAPQQNVPTSTQQVANEFYGHVTAQPQYPQNTHMGGDESVQYQPINSHPNPYGTPQVTLEGPPFPEASAQRNQQMQYTVDNLPQQTLPSRDIPMDTSEYLHDESIRPNHIPSVKLTSDYIRDYEKANEEELKLHRQKQYREDTTQTAIGELQVPILVAVLYFIFQVPIINTLMRKYLSFANLYNEDGNFNMFGLVNFFFLLKPLTYFALVSLSY